MRWIFFFYSGTILIKMGKILANNTRIVYNSIQQMFIVFHKQTFERSKIVRKENFLKTLNTVVKFVWPLKLKYGNQKKKVNVFNKTETKDYR